MLRMGNGFVVTDDDCMQCRKNLGDRKFLFIQAIWLDGNDEYCVVSHTEDLKEMSLNDIECAICGYYEGIKEMEESYGLPLDQLDDLIAECTFENHPCCNWEQQSEIVSLKRAEKIIQAFIDSDGKIFMRS